jgi:mannose-6-phosphate isomerase
VPVRSGTPADVDRLTNPIQPYAWGSRSAIAAMQERPPSADPEAELWIGAHPAGPSTLEHSGVTLADTIAAAPGRMLGARVEAAFGPRLPYLLKVLAADAPLSLQAHPDAPRARDRYAAGDPNYTDANHKPELLVAIEEFEALCGFRDPKVSAECLRTLNLPALVPVADALATGEAGLRSAVTTLLTWPAADRSKLVEVVVASGGRVGENDRFATEYAMAGRLARAYPGDVGVVVALLLNHVTLAPGEALWLPAGNLHSHLRGTGVEVMAASDNVLRGGLTPKRVDVDELLEILRFEILADPVLHPVGVSPGVVTWPVPAAEFTLFRAELDERVRAVDLALEGPRVVLCVRGELAAADEGSAVTLRGGQAAFGPASSAPLRLTGRGEAFLVGVGGRTAQLSRSWAAKGRRTAQL